MITEIVLAIYFVFILLIGVYSATRIKDHTDYYIAGKRAGMTAVSGSLMATILGGSAILGTIELSQSTGWPALWFLLCAALGLLILAPLTSRVKQFGHFTLPEMLRLFYGKKAEIISSVIIPLAWLGIVAAQIIAAAKILSGMDLMGYREAAVLAGAVFILYTLLGGQLSILKTDTLQSVLIVAGLIALFIFSLNSPVRQSIEPLRSESLFNSQFSFLDLLILILTYSVTFVVGPDIYSRLFCARNERTAFRSVLFVAILLVPISFGLTWLGVFSDHSEASGIVSFAQDLLPEWAYGLFIAALLSAVMSSADTTLLTSSMIVNELLTGNLNSAKTMLKTRVLVVFTGVLSIIIALFIQSIIQSLLFALTFFSGAFVVPVLAGLLQWKVNQKNAAMAMIWGGLVALAGKIVHDFYIDWWGNGLIILAYLINFSILMWRYPRRK